MQYRTIGETGIHASVLGIGCMRLPVIEGDNNQIDVTEATKMLRYAIDSGVNYVDTAYPYHGGASETFLGNALKDGYRERVTLITKSPSWLHQSHEDFEKYLDEQLEKLQTNTIDIYLLHAINKTNWENYKRIDVFSAVEKAKASGKIKHIGFSFHDDYAVFEDVINAYPWDVCMIQFNYMDTEEQAGLAGLKYAESKGIPTIVMEPLKGGLLATPSDDIDAIWRSSGESWSPVEWALRFIADFSNVKVVLSGMSNMQQLKQNIEIANRLMPNNLNAFHQLKIEDVKKAYAQKIKVNCTQCQYCLPCPQGVQIPRVFTLYNRASIFNAYENVSGQYKNNIADENKADQCIACGLCEPKCPQSIAIIENLKEAHHVLTQNF